MRYRRPYSVRSRFSAWLAYLLIVTQLVQCGAGAVEVNTPTMSEQPTSPPALASVGANSAPSSPASSSQAQSSPAPGFTFLLGEGKEQAQSSQPLPVAGSQPLSDAALQALLSRLPALDVQAGDLQDFRLPAETLKPPRPGATVQESFPPTNTVVAAGSASPADVASGPLEVVRYAPEGEIRIAPFLQVTFNQPMVPLATLDQLKEEAVPVRITPALPGVWKWIGTKTLVFEYKPADADDPQVDRFPKATEYQVEIPAGTTSANGNKLEQAVTWTFVTPPPVLQYSYPYSYQPQPRNPVLFVSFDQRIDPAAMLKSIQVTAGSEPYEIQLIAQADAAKEAALTSLIKQAGDGRWLAFRATKEFPADSTINVSILPGAPSAEGPIVTKDAQGFSFQTYAPLRITEYGCGYGTQACPPGTPIYINFNNPLDQEKFEPSLITVAPTVTGLIVENYGTSINLRGAFAGRTKYQITVSGSLQDSFGQTLGKDQVLTVETGPATPILSGPNGGLTTLDPSSKTPALTFYTTNYDQLRLRVYAVTPQDWPAYLTYLRDYWSTNTPPAPPGKEMANMTISIDGQPDQMSENSIDLSPYLTNNKGHLLVVLDNPPGLISKILGNRDPSVVQTWVQATRIGLDAYNDHSELVAWTTDLNSGAPLVGVKLSLLGVQAQGESDQTGLWKVELPNSPAQMLIGELDGEVAILPQNTYDYYGGSGWQKMPVSDELRWYVFDDRHLYRPKEEVHVKGWLRLIGGKQDGDVGLPGNMLNSVRYQVVDPQGNTLADEVVDVNALGGFDFAFTLPEGVNLGYANITLTPVGAGEMSQYSYYHSFEIQEFRRPEFEVRANNEGEGPFVLGDEAVVSVSAQYFAGGPLPSAETTWNVNASPTSYSPPNWPDFTFGKWIPWWGFADIYASSEFGYRGFPPPGTQPTSQSFSGRTGADGRHYLKLTFTGGFDEKVEPQPYSVNADAVVMDVNRQAWASSTSLLVHPADLYVGLRSDQVFVEKGDPLKIDLIVTDIDGKAVAGQTIKVRASRQEWKYLKGQYRQEEADLQECEITSGAEAVSCEFKTTTGGQYTIKASVRDARERLNTSQLTRWVSGGQSIPQRNVTQETITLIPNKQNYQPGDTAEILVQSPFGPAEGLLTVARNGILYQERFTITESTITLNVPIKEEQIPNLEIQVNLNGSAPRLDDKGEPLKDAPPRPAFAQGTLSLAIPPLSRTLKLEAVPAAAKVSPGVETSVAITLTDATGKPVKGEVALVAVDEAVLALSNYQLGDPIAAFYSQRGSYLSSTYGRSSIMLANPEQIAQTAAFGLAAGGGAEVQSLSRSANSVDAAAAPAAAAPMAEATMADASAMKAAPMEAEQQQANTPIAVRSDFNPLAVFAPAVQTDEAGRATVSLKLPDNLTRYRIMAVAVADGKYFGMGEANLTARLPLMVRPSAPRFLNFGDQFELPIVLQNQTDEPMEVQVGLRASNLQSGESDIDASQPISNWVAGKIVTVPANDRVEVRFPATTQSVGTARVQIAATAGDVADAATVEMPVYTPATTEAFAVYGVVDEGAIAQPVAAPKNVFSQFGGLEISTSSTALQALTDAVLYLNAYPFECSEQLASRILGVAALRDVLSAFKAAGLPSPEEMEKAVQRDITRLQAMQNFDGGWPVWKRGDESVPYYSIHITHALQRAKLKGYSVPEEMLQVAKEHLRNIESSYPAYYSAQTRHVLSSYAVYVRHLMGDTDTVKARDLFNQYKPEEISLESVAWLWQLLSDDAASQKEVETIRRLVNNRVVETAGAANFVTSYGDQAYLLLHSNRRTDGLLLDALINDHVSTKLNNQPDSDLIPKVVNGLLNQRVAGRWNNTQENAFILLALDRYFNTFEAQTPDFVARIWLGDTYAGEHTYQGRTTEYHQTVIPMNYLIGGDGQPQSPVANLQSLILSKEGTGRLYYRLGLRYAPSDLNMPPLDMGFVVQRSYEAVDQPEDVQRDENGTWHIKAGSRVRVRIKMVADSRRYNMALVDPLPAGLEIINPALATTESIPGDPQSKPYGWWWYSTWYNHQNLRDQRAEAFATLLWEGVYDYDYVARATTPGTFVVPPAKAEEMYSPEVFGRSGMDRVVVE